MAFIGNMDETPVYFDLVPNKVVDRVGVRSCIVRTTGAEKRHITVALTVTANGEMLPPFIIFKGKRQPRLQVCDAVTQQYWFLFELLTIFSMQVPEGVIVRVQQKAWMDKKLMLVYLKEIWKPYIDRIAEEVGLTDTASLLVLDSFRGHTAGAVQEALKEMSTKAPIFPWGCTSKVQPLDVCVNKPFKQLLKAS